MSSFFSRSFLKGFSDGFSAPYALLHRAKYSVRKRDLVTASWREVGMSFSHVMSKELQPHDETASPSLIGKRNAGRAGH